MKKAILAVLFLALAGCTMNALVFRGRAENAGLRIGMTKEDLVRRVGWPPEGRVAPYFFTDGAISKSFGVNGVTEWWHYETYDTRFTVVMDNGRVVSWSEG